jgi:hypothetical protein
MGTPVLVADHHLRVGCAAPTAPAALRRRWLAGEVDDCLARDRHRSLLRVTGAESRQATTSGWRPVRPRDEFLRGFGERIRCSVFETRRTSGAHATDHPRVIESVRRAALLHVRGQPRKEGKAELEPPARFFGARAGSSPPLSESGCDSSNPVRLRVCGSTRWDPPSGRIH